LKIGDNGILADGTKFRHIEVFDRDGKVAGAIFEECFENAKRIGI